MKYSTFKRGGFYKHGASQRIVSLNILYLYKIIKIPDYQNNFEKERIIIF